MERSAITRWLACQALIRPTGPQLLRFRRLSRRCTRKARSLALVGIPIDVSRHREQYYDDSSDERAIVVQGILPS
jgi:hypothetical protein